MKDIRKAVDRINRAVKNKEKITVYGDYDVDGITSVYVLTSYIKSKGIECDEYIQEREGEGYGVNKEALKKIAGGGTSLIITVDSGITAVNEIDFASELGMDVIITDHHETGDELPVCIAVIDPRREDCEYPFTELAGVGVVFKLLCALEEGEDGKVFKK